MAYLGRQPAIGRYTKLDDFSSSFNGSLTTFNLTSGGDAQMCGSEAQLIVSLGGIIQEPETDYTVAGTQITFTTAPLSGDDFFAILFGDTLDVGVPSDDVIRNRHVKSDAAIAMSKLDGSSGSLTALTVDDITINGSTISDSGELTVDVGGDIILDADGGDIIFKDGGTTIGTFANNSNNLRIVSNVSDADLILRGVDGGAAINALTLDMSDAGTAIFNHDVNATSAGSKFIFGHSSYLNTGTSDYPQIHYSNKGNQLLLAEWSATNASEPTLRFLKSASSTIGTNTLVADDENLGAIAFNAADGTDLFSIAATITAYVDGTPGAGDMPGRLVFATTADGADTSTTALTLTSGQAAEFAGGIGVLGATPSNTTGSIGIKLPNEKYLAWYDDSGESGTAAYARGVGGAVHFGGSSFHFKADVLTNFEGDVLLAHDGAVLKFGANSDVLATHVHNVGLDFSSTRSGADSIFRFKNSANASDSDIRLILQTGGTSGGDVMINLDGQATGARFTMGIDTSADKFVIADADKGGFDGSDEVFTIASGGNTIIAGNLGINTSSVTAGFQLEVKADDTTTGGQVFINQAGTGDPGLRFSTAATSYMIGVDNSDSDTFKIDYGTTGVGAQTGISINTSGLIGFGTGSPTEELHIYATAPTIRLEDSQNNLSGFINGDNGNVLLQTHNVNRDIIIGENAAGAELYRFLGLGRFGIATSAPSTSLHVKNGFMRVQAGNQESGDFTQAVGIDWSQESDSQVGKIQMVRTAWGNAPHKMEFYVRNTSSSVHNALTLGELGQVGIGGANYGTDGQVLTSQGASLPPQWEAAGGGAWTLIGTQTASSSASLTQTGIDATYATYCIIIEDFHPSADNATLMFRLGDSSGIDSTSGDYDVIYDAGVENDAFGADNSRTYNFEHADSGIKTASFIGAATGEGVAVVAYLHNARGSGMYPTVTGRGYVINQNGNGETVEFWGHRTSMITTDRILAEFEGSTNIESGRMTVWGIAHA